MEKETINMHETDKAEKKLPKWVATALVTFVLGYGLHYLGYFIRARYYDLIPMLDLGPGMSHVFEYLGHLVILSVYIIYGLVVKEDSRYIFDLFTKDRRQSLKYGLLGGLCGFVMMGICILAAVLNGDLNIEKGTGIGIPLLLMALLAVILQASTEEIESRSFVFGRMKGNGVPVNIALLVSSFFFSYLHAANPGFGFLPLLSIFTVAILYALSYHYFDNLSFACMTHTMWNFTQDFIFGLPDSGKPAAVSIFSSTVNGSGFFYDEVFGVEGSCMSILLNTICIVLMLVIGKKLAAKKKNNV
jgi:membrane protease YdiL (CAAX protease family)